MVFAFQSTLVPSPELPAESCHEIKASGGEQAVSGTYWFYSIVPDKVAFAYCDMKTEDNFTQFPFCVALLRCPVARSFETKPGQKLKNIKHGF